MTSSGSRHLDEDTAWNVTAPELREWAANPDAQWPTQDWDLAVARDDLSGDVLALAVSATPSRRAFFLEVLYLLIGDAVFREWLDHDRGVLLTLLEEASSFPDHSIQLWVRRSRRLLEHPEEFDYAAWCQGGLARTHE